MPDERKAKLPAERTQPAQGAAGPSDLDTLANALAAATQGSVVEVPSSCEHPARAVILESGEVPVLLQAPRGSLQVNVVGEGSWHPRPGAEAVGAVPEVAERARAWAAAHPGGVTMFALATELAAGLSVAFEERWTVSTPGTPVPKEMWLHGADRAAASVGVFDGGRALAWLGDSPHSFVVRNRDELDDALQKIVALVTEQKARYGKHLEASERIRALAAELADALARRLAAPEVSWEWTAIGFPSHEGAVEGEIFRRTSEGARSPVVRIFLVGDQIRAHAGLPGPDGWEDTVVRVDERVEAMAAAIERRLRTLTIDELMPGKRYRVLESIQDLEQGRVVRYRGLDEIDNHHGEYVFEAEDGSKLVVAGDCSTSSHGPLREAHRYLEAVDGD